MEPVVNITGPVTVHIGQPKHQGPVIPVTEFVQKTFLNVDDHLLVFGAMVQERMKSASRDFMPLQALALIKERADQVEDLVKGDYNAELLSKYLVDIAAFTVLVASHYGAELKLPNG
jgi:hypothetical protein